MVTLSGMNRATPAEASSPSPEEYALARPEQHLTALMEHASEPATASAEHAQVDTLLAHIEDAGGASTVEAYTAAVAAVFKQLDSLEHKLESQRYLVAGAQPSKADWWLYCVLVRFDAVYYGLYKCNLRRLSDFHHLQNYLRDLHQANPAPDSTDFDSIKRHYYRKDPLLNPKGVVPLGGVPFLDGPHDRAARFHREAMRDESTEEQLNKPRLAGEWVRKQSRHRHWIQADPQSPYPAEPDRYHLYVANNCPWCHRVTLVRSMKKLQGLISLDTLYFRRDADRGWQFRPELDGFDSDSLYGHQFITDLYKMVDSKERSVPVLFDKKTETIVSNESADIVRMLNNAFGAFAEDTVDLYPEPLRDEIDQLNAWIYRDINNGAYKAGFASSQTAYERAYHKFFAAFEQLDERLSKQRFLTGDQVTEADLRLFPTAFRFDHVYYIRFKLNKRMLRDHRHLYRWLRDMVHYPGVMEGSNLEHARQGYFGRTGNNLVPVGPAFSFGAKPNEEELMLLRGPSRN